MTVAPSERNCLLDRSRSSVVTMRPMLLHEAGNAGVEDAGVETGQVESRRRSGRARFQAAVLHARRGRPPARPAPLLLVSRSRAGTTVSGAARDRLVGDRGKSSARRTCRRCRRGRQVGERRYTFWRDLRLARVHVPDVFGGALRYVATKWLARARVGRHPDDRHGLRPLEDLRRSRASCHAHIGALAQRSIEVPLDVRRTSSSATEMLPGRA